MPARCCFGGRVRSQRHTCITSNQLSSALTPKAAQARKGYDLERLSFCLNDGSFPTDHACGQPREDEAIARWGVSTVGWGLEVRRVCASSGGASLNAIAEGSRTRSMESSGQLGSNPRQTTFTSGPHVWLPGVHASFWPKNRDLQHIATEGFCHDRAGHPERFELSGDVVKRHYEGVVRRMWGTDPCGGLKERRWSIGPIIRSERPRVAMYSPSHKGWIDSRALKLTARSIQILSESVLRWSIAAKPLCVTKGPDTSLYAEVLS